MASSDECYPGIKYCEIVEDWRQKDNYYLERYCLFFVFENIPKSFSSKDICCALTDKYGDEALDGMRTVHTRNETSIGATPYYTVVVEAHFSSNQTWENAYKEAVASLGKVSVRNSNGEDALWIKVIKPLPLAPPTLSVYSFDGLPLGSHYYLIKTDLLNPYEPRSKPTARKSTGLPAIYWKPKCMGRNKYAEFVDISPDLFADKYFNGSVSVIFKDVDIPTELEIVVYGKTLTPSRYGEHYLYCTNCRYLDSHAGEDCPLPQRD